MEISNPGLSSRRSVLLGTAAIVAATALPLPVRAKQKPFFGAKNRPLGLQLYTMGDVAKKSLDDTLVKIAAAGYRTVELAGYHEHTPEQLRKAADQAGLTYPSIHVGAQGNAPDPSLSGDLPALAAQLHTLGVKRVVMPMFVMPDHIAPQAQGERYGDYFARAVSQITADDWKRTAAFLNAKGAALRALGLRLGYHNHNTEFSPLPGGTTGLDILIKETDPQQVSFEMDAGWVAAAGVDPVKLLQKYPRRFTQMHVKDIGQATKSNFTLTQVPAEVGRGTMDWKAILPAAEHAGVDQFFVEQEPPFTIDRFEAIAVSSKYLLTL